MIRNLKIGMALAAALAMSAIGASAAMAASSLDVGAAPAIITGEQATQNKLTITGAKGETLTTVKCATANLSATTTTANVTEATLTPTYGDTEKTPCEVGGLAATVHVNGCTYTLTNSVNALTAEADVVCPTGKKIEITQGTCVISVSPQGPLSHITFANNSPVGAPKHVTATLTVSGIVAVGSAGCVANLQGAHNADLTGTQTVKAYKDEGGVEGAQVSLEAT